jgi:hypothetical protein
MLVWPSLLLYAAAGDSVGGNLVLAGLGLLREQGRLAALPTQLEALVLLSPAVDMSNLMMIHLCLLRTCCLSLCCCNLCALQLVTLQVATWFGQDLAC